MMFTIKENYAEQRQEKLGVKDKKLIQLLIQNSRFPHTILSKKIGISKVAIGKKINSLKNKGILLEPVTYINVNAEETNIYFLEVETNIGLDIKETSKKLLKIESMKAVLWYNGPFNLLFVVESQDSQKIVESIETILPIIKIRIRKVIGNWFHPPHIFKEIPDLKIQFTTNKVEISNRDKDILKAIVKYPNSSLLNLADEVSAAPTTVKKSIQKMLQNKTILQFSQYINFWKCGLNLISISFIVKGRKNTEDTLHKILSIPQTGNVWELEHEWNINAIFWVNQQFEVNSIINELLKTTKGILHTEVMVLTGMIGQ